MPPAQSGPFLTAAESRALDRLAMDALGLPGALLMENAGRALAGMVRALRVDPSTPVVLLCGPGNNGGDGFVAARWLAVWGVPHVAVRLGSPRDVPAGDAGAALATLRAMGRDPVVAGSAREFRSRLPDRRWLGVDCVFGTGLTRAVEGPIRACLEVLDDHAALKVAADLPSGVDADTGEILGFAPRCQVTLSFLTGKAAALIPRAAPFLGITVVDTLGIPHDWIGASVAGMRQGEAGAAPSAAREPRSP